jgi:uncharacterized membrane protein
MSEILREGHRSLTFGSKELLALALTLIAITDLAVFLNIPVLRQVLGFVLLTFLTGFLLLQNLKLNNFTPLEKAAVLVGLSVSFMLFIPLLMDLISPALGSSQPISTVPLISTFSVLLFALSIITYERDGFAFRITVSDYRKVAENVLTPPVLGLGFILMLSILGGLSIWFYSNTLLALLSIASIVVVTGLLAANRLGGERFYPFYIVAIAIALQYVRTLASANLFGSDIQYELYCGELVKLAGYWNPTAAVGSDYYSMLSVSILPNVYSLVLNVDTVWVYKVIFPVLFAFVPLGLYLVYKPQFGSRSALLATFLFMSFFGFYQILPAATRMEIALIFVVLVVLLLSNKRPQKHETSALVILFLAGIAVSHYATSYLFIFFLVFVWIGSALINRRDRKRNGRAVITSTVVILCLVVTFGWYAFVSQAEALGSLVSIGSHTATALSTELFAPNADVTLGVFGGGTPATTILHLLARYWQLATEVLMAVGVIMILRHRQTSAVDDTFFLFSLGAVVVAFVVLIVPVLGFSIGPIRSYLVVLAFLAPYCIFGAACIVNTVSRWFGANSNSIYKLRYIALMGLLLPYLLFNSGAIFEVTENPSNYIPSHAQWQVRSNLMSSVGTDAGAARWSYLEEGSDPNADIYAAKWLSSVRGGSLIYADQVTIPELLGYGFIAPASIAMFSYEIVGHQPPTAYVFLGFQNVKQGYVALATGWQIGYQTPSGTLTGRTAQISSILAVTGAENKIYDNGGPAIYYRQN